MGRKESFNASTLFHRVFLALKQDRVISVLVVILGISLAIFALSHYLDSGNGILIKSSAILFLAFSLGIAYRASYINRDPDRYWFLLENGELGTEKLEVVRKVTLNGPRTPRRSHAGLYMFIIGIFLVSVGELTGEFIGIRINLLYSFVLVMVGAGLILMSPVMAISLHLSVER